jgi:hypothetical protein
VEVAYLVSRDTNYGDDREAGALGAALRWRFSLSYMGQDVILRDASTVVVHEAEAVLSRGIALLGGPAIPFDRLDILFPSNCSHQIFRRDSTSLTTLPLRLARRHGGIAVYIIEYLATTAGPEPPSLYMELALGSTPEEAMDQANTHLPSLTNKYGAQGYRILDSNKQCVGIGPEGFLNA